MEAGGVAFALPLVAGPKLEKAGEPLEELGWRVFGEFALDEGEDIGGTALVADGGALDDIEHRIGHEVAFVGLYGTGGAEFGGRLLLIDHRKRRDVSMASAHEWAVRF